MVTRVIPLKHLAHINERSLPDTTDADRKIRYIDIGSVGRGELIHEPERMRFGDAPLRARRLVGPGDTIVSTVRTYLRAVWPVTDTLNDIVVSTGLAVLTPRDIEPRYLSWWIMSDVFIEEVVARSVGVSYPAINASELGEIGVRLPSADEQRAIADYLDIETGRLDALISRKRRTLELLDERWSARVRHVMSSISTNSVALRHLCTVKRGQSPRPIDDPRYFDDGGSHGWVRIEDVTRGGIYLTETRQRLSNIGRARSVAVGPGTVLVSIAATVGKPVITAMNCCYHDGFVGLHNLNAIPEYVYLFLALPEAFGGLGQVGTQTNINSEIVGRIEIPLPDRDEQQRAVDGLNASLRRMEAVKSRLSIQLGLLAEYRKSLITAAVTGDLSIPGAAA